MVAEFIQVLLRSNKKAQDWFFGQQLPREIFTECESEIRWIYSFREANGTYPHFSVFKHRFPKFKVSSQPSMSLEESLQPIKDTAVFKEMTAAIASAKSKYQAGASVSEVLSHLRGKLDSVRDFTDNAIDLCVGKSTSALDSYRARARSNLTGDKSMLPSPWRPLNDLLGFREVGEQNIVASRTSIGKTWLTAWWVKHFDEIGERVLWISKEMPTAQLALRYEAVRFKLDYPLLRKGALPPKDLARWRRERRSYRSENVIISGHESIGGVGFEHILTKIDEYAPTIVFVDGAYLLTAPGVGKNASMVERFTAISNMSKRIAMAKKLSWFNILQIKREAETKSGDTSPSLKDIYGADTWAQDADTVLLLGGRRSSNVRILSLQKSRESAIGDLTIKFKLSPFPDFSVALASSAMSSTSSSVAFASHTF